MDIFHFDVYRLNNIYDFYNIGGEEYFSKGLCIIEWGELIESALPEHFIKITFNRVAENENFRKLTINYI
jgi:tRNA threonylcarbamoyladenosine biosynthesis protein TsaE